MFLVGGLLLTALGSTGSLLGGYRVYARALAGLTHFAILFVPLMALLPAATSLAEERENGTLEYLLAQPVTWNQVFLGTWSGVALAVLLALTAGYLLSAGVSVLRGVPLGLILITYGFLVCLSLVFVFFVYSSARLRLIRKREKLAHAIKTEGKTYQTQQRVGMGRAHRLQQLG